MNDVFYRVHIKVSGRVQGVGYRYFIQQQADPLDLTGWVRNLHDDRVEILAEGRQADLLTFIDLVRQGSKMSQVSELEIDWLPSIRNYHYFMIAPSE